MSEAQFVVIAFNGVLFHVRVDNIAVSYRFLYTNDVIGKTVLGP